MTGQKPIAPFRVDRPSQSVTVGRFVASIGAARLGYGECLPVVLGEED
jgi:hypothetical protein